MKNKRMLTFIMALITFGLVLPLSSCKSDHTPVEEWSHNESTHWHECVEEDCDEKFNEANHTYGSWTVTKEATCTETGSREKECSVCGYKVTETIKALGHKAHEWVLTTEPNAITMGKITVKCSCGHEQVLVIPSVSAQYYIRKEVTGTDPLKKETYWLIQPNILAGIINGTMLENEEEMVAEIEAYKFMDSQKDVACTHKGYEFNVVTKPTLLQEGKATLKCTTCKKQIEIPLHKLGIRYHETEVRLDGKLNYRYIQTINLKDLFYGPYIRPAFETMPITTVDDIMRDIEALVFVDDWYGLEVEVNDTIHDPILNSTKIRYVFKPQNSDIFVEDITVANGIFSFKFTAGKTCSLPVVKEAYVNDNGVALFKGIYKEHPDFATLVKAVKAYTATPSQVEITNHKDIAFKHEIGNAYVKTQPTSSQGAVLGIKCLHFDDCGSERELALVNLSSAEHFTNTYEKGVEKYAAKESYIDLLCTSLMNNYNNTKQEIRTVIAPLLKFEVELPIQVSVPTSITSNTTKAKIKLSHPGYDNVQTFEFPYTLSTHPQYFKVTYNQTSCDTMVKKVYLNETGLGVASRLSKIIPVNKVKEQLKNVLLGSFAPTDAEFKENKTEFHNFVFDTLNQATQDNTQSGSFYVSCNKQCHKTFFVTYSYEEAFVEGDTGYLVLEPSIIINKFANKYPTLVQQELDAIEAIIWAHINEF